MDNNKRGNSTLYDGLEYEIVSLQKQIQFLRRFDNTEELRNNIKKYASKSIAKYALPAEYEYVEELPKTKLGKIDYKKL